MSVVDTQSPPAAVHEPERDAIDSWLAVLVRLLDVAGRQADAIRDEIEAHLRERVRDLMITGRSEAEAIRIAIGELGEVADLARRFSHASRSRTRRIIMNAAVLAFGAIGVATATVFMGNPQAGPSRVAVFQAAPTTPRDATPVLDDKRVKVDFQGQPLIDVLGFLSASAGLDLVLDRHALEDHGVDLQEEITLSLSKQQPVSSILKIVAEHAREPFAWRASGSILEISTDDEFDRREIVLASFDVRPILDLLWQTTQDEDEAATRLESLVVEYVQPYSWSVNGGDLGSLQIVGGKMFVKAPSRFHQPIEWILAQLEDSATEQAAVPSGMGWRRSDATSRYYRSAPAGIGQSTAPSTWSPLSPGAVQTPSAAGGAGRAGAFSGGSGVSTGAAPAAPGAAGQPGSPWPAAESGAQSAPAAPGQPGSSPAPVDEPEQPQPQSGGG